MSEVRAAPKREVVVDWWVSPWGGGGGDGGDRECAGEGAVARSPSVDGRCRGRGGGGENAAHGCILERRGKKWDGRRHSSPRSRRKKWFHVRWSIK
jgi:hypothetical protein